MDYQPCLTNYLVTIIHPAGGPPIIVNLSRTYQPIISYSLNSINLNKFFYYLNFIYTIIVNILIILKFYQNNIINIT